MTPRPRSNIMKPLPLPLLTFCLLSAAWLTAGCGQRHSGAAPEPLVPRVAVRARTVESLERVATEEVVGTVRPKLSASLSVKISGIISQMLVTPGQAVKAEQLLAAIDAREWQARLDQAQAVYEQTQKERERLKKLLEQNAVTQQEFDMVQSRFLVAEGAVTEAQTLRSYTQITAPFAGIITAKLADVGDLAAPGKPLLELEDPNALRFEADVPEALLPQIQLRSPLAVQVPSAGVSVAGIVREIAPAIDPLSRTFRVKLDLPIAGALRSGQFGRVAVPVANVKAIRVPASAVIVRGQMEIAFVVTTPPEPRALMRLVKTGKHLGAEIEVVSGLREGERIVVEGGDSLLDGQPVEVTP